MHSDWWVGAMYIRARNFTSNSWVQCRCVVRSVMLLASKTLLLGPWVLENFESEKQTDRISLNIVRRRISFKFDVFATNCPIAHLCAERNWRMQKQRLDFMSLPGDLGGRAPEARICRHPSDNRGGETGWDWVRLGETGLQLTFTMQVATCFSISSVHFCAEGGEQQTRQRMPTLYTWPSLASD